MNFIGALLGIECRSLLELHVENRAEVVNPKGLLLRADYEILPVWGKLGASWFFLQFDLVDFVHEICIVVVLLILEGVIEEEFLNNYLFVPVIEVREGSLVLLKRLFRGNLLDLLVLHQFV